MLHILVVHCGEQKLDTVWGSLRSLLDRKNSVLKNTAFIGTRHPAACKYEPHTHYAKVTPKNCMHTTTK